MKRFENKTFVVTGGSSGIGKATALRLADEGAKVIVTGTNQSRLSDVEASHESITALKNDASKPESAKELANFAKDTFGKLNGVYLNAGFAHMAPLGNIEAADFDDQFSVNVRAPLLQAQALSELIKEKGSILITTSVVQDVGMAGMAVYSATKGAVRTLTRTLAREFAERHIRVNAVSPGPIGSNFFERMDIGDDQQQEMSKQIEQMVPLGRFGEPEEVAAVACFLMSDDASYVTGSQYTVDGGMTEM